MKTSKNKKAPKTSGEQEGGNTSVPAVSAQTAVAKKLKVQLDRVALRRLAYAELPTSEKPTPLKQGERLDIGLKFDGKINIFPQGVEVYVGITVHPDPKHKPVEIVAGLSAFFRRPDDVPDEELLDFAKGPALRIIFPYLREAVSNVSQRGMYGPVWLDPLNVSILTDPQTPWEADPE
jgi:preprotein translocase subunit SecB